MGTVQNQRLADLYVDFHELIADAEDVAAARLGRRKAEVVVARGNLFVAVDYRNAQTIFRIIDRIAVRSENDKVVARTNDVIRFGDDERKLVAAIGRSHILNI